jgi:putative DNA primase/helicase
MTVADQTARGGTLPATHRHEELELKRASQIRLADIEWLWPGWIAAKKFHVLAGDGGTGKTTLSLAMASVISKGGAWPDGSAAPVGNVIVWSGEDDANDTIAPRLRAAGADMERIFIVGDVRVDGGFRPFDPSVDLPVLAREADRVGRVALVIVDPVVSVVAGDGHKNADVRRSLQPLVDLGTQLGCAVLGISHFSKGSTAMDPLQRVTGSIAFGAVARVVLVAGKKAGNDVRVLARAKSNIGPDADGFGYRIELSDEPFRASYVIWGGPLVGSARDLLADHQGFESAEGAGKFAEKWLADFLRDGPQPVAAIEAASERSGVSWRTLERAKSAIGARSEKDASAAGWRWVRP